MLVLGILIIYAILFLIIVFFFLKIENFKQTTDINTFISIVVVFRNEATNIIDLINSLHQQTYCQDYFEIIFVDDASTDNTQKIILENIKLKNYKILSQSEHKGKKYCLQQAINEAKGDLIVTTDADCSVAPKWLETINAFYSQKKPKMIVMPVTIEPTKRLFSFQNMQVVEFASLQTVTAATIQLNSPTMCNAANLAFEKNIINQFSDPFKSAVQSGDDVFLMFNIQNKYPRSIKYLKSAEVLVTTKPLSNIPHFFNQRIRWSSKTVHYTDFFTLFIAILVLLTNSVAILCYPSIFQGNCDCQTFLLSKILIDVFVVGVFLFFVKQQRLLLLFPILSLVYPFYVVSTVIFSIFSKVHWK